ncbi:ATP-binding cassette domain-containing protein, partial [Cereibacter sediminicola]|uniref:ATP-binding cassette domain-containing protein n=1 Tax=Cereibacter sediminicola TaxID=2584941 RepID=UPI0011A464DE
MTQPIIRIDRLEKSFGSLKVLDGLSFDVMPGEKLALIGPSGSGKTTILRILMTLETITGGHVEVCGEQLFHMTRKGVERPADEAHLHHMRRHIG